MTRRSEGQTAMASAVTMAIVGLALVMCALLPTFAMEAPHCQNCMDGMPMTGCLIPQQCGYKPIMCVNCMDGMAMPQCPDAKWCTGIDCSKMQCIDGQPTPTCPDPGTCGFAPIPCVGCVPGVFRFGCPRADWCAQNQTTFPCIDCMSSMAMPLCPNATACLGAGTRPTPTPPTPTPGPQCEGCMAGMAMPNCPNPDLCVLTSSCTMLSVFGTSSSVCVFLADWGVSNAAQWVATFFGVLMLAFLREGLSVWRLHRNFSRKQEDNLRRMYARDSLTAAKLGVAVAPSSLASSNPNAGSSVAQSGSSTIAMGGVVVKNGPFVAVNNPGANPIAATGSSSSQLHSLTRDRMDSDYRALPPASPNGPRPLPRPESDIVLHFFDSFYYLLSLTLGYLLMLLVMSYNLWLCLLTVGCCFLAHFISNYVYFAWWRRKKMHAVRSLVHEFVDAQKEGGRANIEAGGFVIDADAPPTGGDHCCEDINYDDI